MWCKYELGKDHFESVCRFTYKPPGFYSQRKPTDLEESLIPGTLTEDGRCRGGFDGYVHLSDFFGFEILRQGKS